MKKISRKTAGVAEGAPSAVVLSLVIHAGLFLLASLLVVFTVVKKEEKKFEPPKAVERPKMKLKKPKVKPQKSSKPKSTTRIVTKVTRANMPDIQLPELSGMGDGLAGGLSGFDLMPDIGETTLFGGAQSIGNDFVGTFYDMKRDRQGRKIPFAKDSFKQIIRQFLVNDWDPSEWSKYYRSPKKLYASNFIIPPIPANMAPEAFGEPDCVACCWVAHYKGQLVYPEDIKFRFWGHGDEFLAVRVNGEVSLLAAWPLGDSVKSFFSQIWRTSASESLRYVLGNCYAEVGDWITLKAGEPVDMEVIVGEINGAIFCSMLCVEVEGEEYPKNPYKLGPKLPIFKTEEPSLTMAEDIWARLDPGDATVTNGPVFRDYKIEPRSTAGTAETESELKDPKSVEEDEMRLWTTEDGKTIEAEFITYIAGNVVLKTSRGKQLKVPYALLSKADQLYVDLASPPEFNIDFSNTSRQVSLPESGPFSLSPLVMQLFDYTFGVKMKQTSTGDYNHPVTIEYFSVGEEVDGDNYILLERGSDTFTPSDMTTRSHEFYGRPVRIERFATRDSAPLRGNRFDGYLITVTDARGKIIQHKASSDFLLDILEDLKKLPVTRHFDRDGQRVCPPRPTVMDRPDWMRAGITP